MKNWLRDILLVVLIIPYALLIALAGVVGYVFRLFDYLEAKMHELNKRQNHECE